MGNGVVFLFRDCAAWGAQGGWGGEVVPCFGGGCSCAVCTFRCGWGVAQRGFAVVKGKFVGGGLTFQHAGQGAAHFRGETLLLVGVSWDVCEVQGWATFVQADCC